MTWRAMPVEGFGHLYEFNETGAVRRIAGKRRGHIMRGTVGNKGYIVFYLQDTRAKRAVMLRHRLIAIANVPNPENKPEVNHIDGNKLNNAIENLEWVTHAENMAHARRTGLLPQSDIGPGERSPASKLDDAKVRAIKARLKVGATHKQLAAEYGVVTSTISWIARGVTWAHIS